MNDNRRFVIAGTDTDVGKTVFAAALAGVLDADYWKPIQAGLDGPTDRDVVKALSGLDGKRLLPEIYRLRTPASPHLAAELDGLEIDVGRLVVPETKQRLVIELAGGLLVPITRSCLQIDVVERWGLPVVLVARTALGTINHTLLSLEALRARAIGVIGVAFVGDENIDSEQTICAYGAARWLGRLPVVDPLTREGLAAALMENFDMEAFD
ncbi:MAG: dethiobiotin synthase [Alphaproteobacteria bacterium]|nr:dethiobiotin synthase [Alphaproteobacteria bacterium]